MSNFTPEVYERIREGCKKSAAVIAPAVQELVQPAVVLDVGGGEGWWADAFVRAGASLGLVLDDGAATYSEGLDGRVQFRAVNLESPTWDDGIGPGDLAVCLEVGEHLRADAAESLVRGLVALAPVVLFSAAIPGQGGHGHLNEQWPAYWADLFYQHGLVCSDALRDEFWDYDEVEPWYRQNLLLFAHSAWFDSATVDMPFGRYPRAVVHPDIYGWRIAERDELAARRGR